MFLGLKMYVKKMLYKFGVFHCDHVVVAMLDIIELLVQTWNLNKYMQLFTRALLGNLLYKQMLDLI